METTKEKETQKHCKQKDKVLMLLSYNKYAFTFVRGAGGEAASGGDVIIFVLREVVLDFFDQGEARGKGSRG